MKARQLIAAVAVLAALCAPAFAATDYSSYSTEELNQMRGTMRDASSEEKAAFQSEWQNRLDGMSREERQRYLGPAPNAPRDGRGTGAGQDRGGGRGYGRGGAGGGGGGGRQ